MRPILNFDSKINKEVPIFKEIVDRMISSNYPKDELEDLKSAIN